MEKHVLVKKKKKKQTFYKWVKDGFVTTRLSQKDNPLNGNQLSLQ